MVMSIVKMQVIFLIALTKTSVECFAVNLKKMII